MNKHGSRNQYDSTAFKWEQAMSRRRAQAASMAAGHTHNADGTHVYDRKDCAKCQAETVAA